MTEAPIDYKIEAKPLAPDWSAAWEPPPDLTVSEWADRYRRLPQTSATPGGRWRTADVPYLREIMDAARDPFVSKIALMKCAQSGGSESIHNILGYFMEYEPCPILMVHPTDGQAQEWSKDRLSDLIDSTPALRAIVRDQGKRSKSQEPGSTLALKFFAGGFLACGSAKTPNTFARRAVRIAIADDVDRFPPTVGEEGDPAELLVKRTTTFPDALSIFVSTPTMKRGRIDTLYSRSDQRRFVLRCPECDREDWVTWTGKDPDPRVSESVRHFGVIYDSSDVHAAPATARLGCPEPAFGGCGALMAERDRRRMVLGGRWKATRKSDELGLVGFHLPGMISLIGNMTLPEMVSAWLSAQGKDSEALKVFINTSLAEAWEDKGTRAEAHSLMRRREAYGQGIEVPERVVTLMCGVDVQVDRFEAQVVGFGPNEERWVVDVFKIPGDPKLPETQAALLSRLQRQYTHASGFLMGLHSICIDTGYLADEIYDFVLANRVHFRGHLYCTKGYAGRRGEPIIRLSKKTYGGQRRQKPGQRGRDIQLGIVNVDDAKDNVLAAMLAEGDGRMHWPEELDTIDEEYFAQMCAEHKEVKYNKKGVAVGEVWVQDRKRNEALDTAVLAFAALRIRKPNLFQLKLQIERMKESGPGPAKGGDDRRRSTPVRRRARMTRSPDID